VKEAEISGGARPVVWEYRPTRPRRPKKLGKLLHTDQGETMGKIGRVRTVKGGKKSTGKIDTSLLEKARGERLSVLG